jgi:ATP-dependent protease ClpP protease subunit
VTAAQFVRDLQNIDAGEINLRINSVGGSVFDALAIHNALERHPATVNVHVDGIALSAASLIAMAGDTVSMAENALMMIHAPWTIAMGDANAMRDVADMLDKMSEALSKNYARKSGKTPAEMLALCRMAKTIGLRPTRLSPRVTPTTSPHRLKRKPSSTFRVFGAFPRQPPLMQWQ